jgi:hypothetical protein
LKRSPLKRKSPLVPGFKTKKVKTVQAIKNSEAKGNTLSRGQLIKLCDVEWAKLVKLNAGYKCEWCGADAKDAHHMVSRRHAATRHDPLNGVALCKGCHLHFHNAESLTGWDKFRTGRPLSYSAVFSARYDTVKFGTHDYRNVLEMLRAEIAKLEAA